MRFWSPFHTSSIDIISDAPNKLIFRAPDRIRLQMTADHLDFNQNPGTCLTHYNYETRLWECFHSPHTTGQHRLFLWALDTEKDDQWATAVRFDFYIRQKGDIIHFPKTTNAFTVLRCQLLKSINGCLSRESLPTDIIIRVPGVRGVQLQIDEQTLITGKNLKNSIYSLQIPANIPAHVKDLVVMGLCANDTYYSVLITYKIE
ncbi:unnamed protein product [Adineta ricciae]|uniref:Uncharacterized protein n=1 Tax=Adineta ricciae TaxID=249248 RepID=A0A815ZSN0_ADIRI|nr:unnamed protein product [Adineta ricciae]